MSTTMNMSSLFDRAMHIKRQTARKLSTVSGVDIVGGTLDAVEKADRMIDKLPYYSRVEETISETLSRMTDKELNDMIAKSAVHAASLVVVAVSGKSTKLFLKNREMTKAGRIFAGSMAVPMAASVVMLAVEKRRRGKSPMPNPYYVPIDEVTGQSDNQSDDEIRAEISEKLRKLFGE